MSAMPFALLLTTAAATAVGAAALHAAHGLRKQVVALRTELAESRVAHASASVPEQQNRDTAASAEEIRAAVADALAEERERELAEARAFWAAQEARDAADAPSLLGGLSGLGEDAPFFMPRQADFAGLEAMDLDAPETMDELVELTDLPEVAESVEFAEDSPELAAPAAATPRTRTSSPYRPRWSPITSAPWTAWSSSPSPVRN